MSVNVNRQVIKELLDSEGIGYNTLRLDTFCFTDEGGPSRMKTCEVFCRAESDLIQVYAYCPIRGEETCMAKLLEYVTRANYDLRVGNFEYDVRDGELRYKATLYTGEEENATTDQLQDVISAAVSTLHMYVDGFVRLNFDPDATVKECLEESETLMRRETDAEEPADRMINFEGMDTEERERCAQLLYDELMERIDAGGEEDPADEED